MILLKHGLFVGTREEANDAENLKKYHITRVLTIDSELLDEEIVANITRLHVNCLDETTADLLTSFDRCIEFIDEGLKNSETVLVHCHSGISRSVTVLLAYYMKTENMTLDEAVDKLKMVYSPDKVNPNPGFLNQLRFYEEMGKTVDKSSTIFKQYRLEMLANQIQEKNHTSNGILMSQFLEEVKYRRNLNDQQFKCKKCRITLFNLSNLVEHKAGQGSNSFGWQKRTKSYQSRDNGNIVCTSLFIEPVNWMSLTLLGSVEGKLSCPNCNCRLGSFNWSGMQCSCGSWVTPAFQFHKTKLDYLKTVSASNPLIKSVQT